MLILHYTGMPTASSALDLLRGPQARFLPIASSRRRFASTRAGGAGAPGTRGKGFRAGRSDVNHASIGVENCASRPRRSRPYPARNSRRSPRWRANLRTPRDSERARVAADIAGGERSIPRVFSMDAMALEGVGHYVAPAPICGGEALGIGDAGPRSPAASGARAYGYDIEPTGRYDEATADVWQPFSAISVQEESTDAPTPRL